MSEINCGNPASDMLFKKKKSEEKPKTFIDLNDYPLPVHVSSVSSIKVVEMQRFDDLKPVTDMAYRGNVMVMDFSKYSEDTDRRKEMARYLLKVAKDTDGSFLEASDTLMILSPGGMTIDRCRITYKSR